MSKKHDATFDAFNMRLASGDAGLLSAKCYSKKAVQAAQQGDLKMAAAWVEIAATVAKQAADECAQAADAIKLEALRQSGGSVVDPGALLHSRERDAREADKRPNTFCPHLG